MANHNLSTLYQNFEKYVYWNAVPHFAKNNFNSLIICLVDFYVMTTSRNSRCPKPSLPLWCGPNGFGSAPRLCFVFVIWRTFIIKPPPRRHLLQECLPTTLGHFNTVEKLPCPMEPCCQGAIAPGRVSKGKFAWGKRPQGDKSGRGQQGKSLTSWEQQGPLLELELDLGLCITDRSNVSDQ